MTDEEYRMYFRQLRNATMSNPIDYISQPEGIDGEYNNVFFANKSKFIKNTRSAGLVMLPNDLVEAVTMTASQRQLTPIPGNTRMTPNPGN